MKYKVKYTAVFKKSYKLMIKRGLDVSQLDDVIEKLSRGEQLDSKYRNHILIGDFLGYRECHIKPDWLLIYYIEEDELILTCINTGTHSDLYN